MPKPIPQVADKPTPDLAEGATASAPRDVSWMTGKLHEMFGYGFIWFHRGGRDRTCIL